ncbi:MAG TPA: sigma 54-interacting transcriptional regulator [Vicinamibacterales bacterium]|jgi:hypothetical protein|nr:sigma 54-interacting transcriptional regulator [Vicinamibacterales bacterium]
MPIGRFHVNTWWNARRSFLQEREFQRLGGTRTQKGNVRMITATNRDSR